MPPITKTLADPPPDPLHTSIVGLRQKLEDVVAESVAYRREVESYKKAQEAKDVKRDRQRRRENLVGVLVAVALAIPILITLALLGQNIGIARNAERSAAEAKRAAVESARTGELIADCTTPTGKCYQSSSKRTSGALVVIRRDAGIVAWCAKITSTKPAQDRCVADLTAASGTP